MVGTQKLARVLVFFTLAILLISDRQVACKAIFGIGSRIIGDQLLLKDVLQARASGIAQSPKIEFNYILVEPITYIQILSEQNVLAKVHFSYQHDLVQGVVAAINATTTPPFEVLITIYGFNETTFKVDPTYVLNKNQHFVGALEPLPYDNEDDITSEENTDEYLTTSEDYVETFDNPDENNIDEELADKEFEHRDKIMEVGQRQPGDYIIYETYQTSLKVSEQPTNHTVVFYYVDSEFITYAKFVIFDHFKDTPSADYRPPLAEYTHFSPTTLKASITDHNVTNLFVQMFLYGYTPKDLPVGYVPFLRPTRLHGSAASGGGSGSNEAPMSPIQRLKLLMNAQQNVGATTEAATQPQEEIKEDNREERDKQQLQIGANSIACLDNAALVGTSRGTASMSAVLLIMTAVGVGVMLR